MTLRPCLDCGEPSDSPHCPEHQPNRPADTRDRDRGRHVASANNTRWKAFSKRMRTAVPFCEACGATTGLTVDHLIPVSVAPELTFIEENVRVLCLVCNGARGNRFTRDDALAVLARLQAVYARTHKRAAGRRVIVAQRAVRAASDPTLGDNPTSAPVPPHRGRQNVHYTPAKSVNR
jgi:5-methylcytosine-specific restriction endonuclease McrA